MRTTLPRVLRGRSNTDRNPAFRRGAQRGQVLAMVALGIVALVGAVGLAIDGSRMLEERRNAQAAVDHAALAASYASCSGSLSADAIQAGYDSATANHYPDSPPTIDVTIAVVDAATHTFRAEIDSTVDSTFARVLGFTTFTVSVEATAGGEGCGAAGGVAGPGAIYVGGICTVPGKYGVDISGSSSEVYGGVHTNDDANVGGSTNIFFELPNPPDDYFTHVGSINPAAEQNNSFQAPWPEPTAMPNPQWLSGWDPAVVTGVTTGTTAPPSGSFLRPYYDLAVAQGHFSDQKITSIAEPGVYYSTATDVAIDGQITAPGGAVNVSLIAPNGMIVIAVSSKDINPVVDTSLPRQGIIMLSKAARTADKTCEDPTIKLSGSNVDWNGVVWGVSGQVEFSGSTNDAVNGSIVAHSVKLNGSDLIIRYNSTFFPATDDPTIILLK